MSSSDALGELMRCRFVSWTVALLLLPALAGCQDLVRKVLPRKTFHENFNWRAEDFFHDPQVVALCHAIEANDIAEIDRLVAAGADVNSQGKGKMTPLLWAFPDNKLERFKRLLEHGADPNVVFEDDYGAPSAIRPGESVTHMAAATTFPGYFDAVFSHGGDPNLIERSAVGDGDTPIFSVIMSRASNETKKERLRLLVEQGADINHVNANGRTPTMVAFGWFSQFDIALMLLEAGADHSIYQPTTNQRLAHIVVGEKDRVDASLWTPEQHASYDGIVRWLEVHGESLEQARIDRERWKSWRGTLEQRAKFRRQEIADRKFREPPWNAEDYFDDPKVVALCRAIEANDLAEIDRLVADGADVNAQGEGTMTPLLWAFPPPWVLSDPPGKLDTFRRLLKHGANPNVEIQTNSKMRSDGMNRGDSVTHMACATPFPGYFEAVFEHGGDLDFPRKTPGATGDTPLLTLIRWNATDKQNKIRFLLAKGADINPGNYAAVAAIGQYDILLMLLESGADYRFYDPRSNKRLVHLLLDREHRVSSKSAKTRSDYEKALKWLDAHGESVGQARSDEARWKSWSKDPREYRRKMDAEIEARKEREAREK